MCRPMEGVHPVREHKVLAVLSGNADQMPSGHLIGSRSERHGCQQSRGIEDIHETLARAAE